MSIEIGLGAYLPKQKGYELKNRPDQNNVGTRKSFAEIMKERPKVPYANMVKDGKIEYNGVTFIADERTNSLNLGDCSCRQDYITISLEGGGVLNVNRDNYGDLSKCMDMFSPEDRERILRAIQQDIHLSRKRHEIEEMEDEIGGNMTTEEE